MGPVLGLVLAAGGSTRMGRPKQLAELDGRPLLAHALAALDEAARRGRSGPAWRPLGPFAIPHGRTAGYGPRSRPRVAGRVATIIAAEARLAAPRAGALAAAIVGMAEGAAGWWLDERRPLDAGELADELAGLLLGCADVPLRVPCQAGSKITTREEGY